MKYLWMSEVPSAAHASLLCDRDGDRIAVSDLLFPLICSGRGSSEMVEDGVLRSVREGEVDRWRVFFW